MKTKFAIGCLVQWYEIELVSDYLQSVKNSLDIVGNKERVIVDLYFNCSQKLEKIDENQITISEIKSNYKKLLYDIFNYDEDTFSVVGCNYNF